MTAGGADPNLVELGREVFGDISDAEASLLTHAVAGTEAVFDDDDLIRARVIRWLCTDRRAATQIHARGLLLRGAAIDDEDLNLNGANVDFRLILRACKARLIQLSDTRLRTVNLDGVQCEGIVAERSEIAGSLLVRSLSEPSRDCLVRGPLSLLRAKIAGDLDCTGATFVAAGGVAIELQRCQIGGTAFLRRGRPGGQGEFKNFFCHGAINLPYAEIAGALDCTGALLLDPWSRDNSTPLSLDATRASLGTVFLGGAFRATGGVVMDGVTVKGPMICDGAQFKDVGFQAYAAEVGLALRWTNVVIDGDDVEVGLAFADVGTLEYDMASWPGSGRVKVTGLSYRSLQRWLTKDEHRRGMREADIAGFLDVIRRQTLASRDGHRPGSDYTPQPYEQLAAVLRASGHERDARDVLVARTDDAMHGRSSAMRACAAAVRLAVGYGYHPLRVLVPIVFMFLLGAVLFGIAFDNQDFKFTNASHPPFSSFAFSLDALAPFLDLGQEKAWTVATPGVTWVSTYYWIHVCVGWLLSSFVVLGVTRSVR